MDPWKRRFLLETIISRFHVNFWGCNTSNHTRWRFYQIFLPASFTNYILVALENGVSLLHEDYPRIAHQLSNLTDRMTYLVQDVPSMYYKYLIVYHLQYIQPAFEDQISATTYFQMMSWKMALFLQALFLFATTEVNKVCKHNIETPSQILVLANSK